MLDLLPTAKRLKHGARVRFHHGTAEILGRVSVAGVERAEIAPEFARANPAASRASRGVDPRRPLRAARLLAAGHDWRRGSARPGSAARRRSHRDGRRSLRRACPGQGRPLRPGARADNRRQRSNGPCGRSTGFARRRSATRRPACRQRAAARRPGAACDRPSGVSGARQDACRPIADARRRASQVAAARRRTSARGGPRTPVRTRASQRVRSRVERSCRRASG